LASYTRLGNVYRFALTGIPLLRLDTAPFNNNFSKYASIYKLEKDLEWDHALSEGRVAFSVHDTKDELQAFLYWR
jgi:predicted component of type VI protein secretion system